MGCCGRHFCALLNRNFIYRKRNLVSSLFQFIFPIATIGILVAIKYGVKDTDGFKQETVQPEIRTNNDVVNMFSFQDFIDTVMENRTCIPNVDRRTGGRRVRNLKFSVSGIERNSWPVPFLKCDARRCTNLGMKASDVCEVNTLVIAADNPNDATSTKRVDSFFAYITQKYPDAVVPHHGLDYPMVSMKHDGEYWTQDKVKNYVTSVDYGKTGFPKIAVAVVLDGGSADEYGYQIRVNSTNFNVPEFEARPVSLTTPSTKRIFDNFAKKPDDVCSSDQGGTPDLGSREDECTAQYMYNGALPIQRLVDDWIIFENTGGSDDFKVAENGVSFVNFPTRKFVKDGFYKQIEPFAPLLLVLGLMYPMASAVRSIVSEKELRQKELMKMMSITEFTIGWSWFVSLWIFYFLIGIGCTIVTALLYENSAVPMIFFFWQISLLAVLMYAKVIAAVNVKTSRATLISVLIFFCGYFIIQSVKYDEGSIGAIRGSSLHPVAAISFGIQMIGSLEDKGVGITRDTLMTTDNPSGYTMGNCFQSLIIDIILWGLFSGYLNRVVKGEYGQALPWNYCFTRKYWFGSSDFDESTVEESDANENIPMEPVSDVLKAQEQNGTCVAIRNLSKQFDTKTAVDGLNLTMYNGQITALLGHNGAGKTTTINMLTGMVVPTSGYAVVNGNNIINDMSKVRKNIGICLQHDCLFPLLTVKEHVEFFATVKGIYEENTYDDAVEHIKTAIDDVALSEKINTYSKDLSGGMKRKLSVAIAFCGGSNVVFLDEPTSGMDPYSRRFTWNVIRQYRENRCIVLTTHFMDEADLLGDRIAIMAEGQLRCCGSSLFLKKKFGVGYQLTIEKLPKSSETGGSKQIEDDLQVIVKSNVAESTLLSNVGTEISFQLPIGASSQFSGLFDQLDERVEKKEIVTYGVGITTLDEVFLMVARGEIAEKTESMKSSLKLGDTSMPNIDTSTYNSREEITGRALFSSHMKSLVMKRAMNFKRDKKAWCCSAILPVVLVFIGFLLVTLAIPGRNLEKLDLSLEKYNSKLGSSETRNPIFYNNPGEFTCQPGSCLYSKNIYNDTDGKMKYLCGASAGINDKTATCSITQSDDIAGEFSGFGAYGAGKNFSNVSISSQYIYNNSELSKEETLYGAVYFTHDNSSQVSGSSGQTYDEIAASRCVSRGGTNCQKYTGIGYVVSTNFTSLHSSLLFQALADEAIIREATGKSSFKIKPSIWPLPITDRENNFSKAESSFAAWFLIILSFPFITGAYATFIVTERMTKAKHLQTVAGVKPSAYWLSTYLWDVLNYQIPLWLIIVLMYVTGVDAFTKNERDIPGAVILLLVAFGPAAAGFTYCVSFLFKSPSSANLFVIVFNFFIGLAGPLTCFILRLIQATNNRSGDGTQPQTLKNAAVIVESICRFIPSFALAKGLFFTVNIESFATIEERPDLSAWSTDILLLEFIFLIIEGLAYVWLAVLIDRLSTKPRAVQMWKSFVSCITCKCFCSSKKEEIVAKKDVPLDEDVATEADRIQSGEGNSDLIVINGLTKVYDGGKLAVDHLTFGIPAGECFGLLGINGAGKTSTMAMLTAEFPPTEGDATLAGYSVTNQPEQTRRRIGYCPQFDAHFQNMTGREHVELYASIKGVPREFVREAAAAKLAEVGLSEFDSDRLSAGYSGGMKRKLSVACATIGNPQIVFLDEPSTGMDPVARRDLWKVISNMVVDEATGEEKNSSIILTTHSMEECEALCPRIGIMAAGQLKCLGSAQQLKTRFGQGFQVEIKVLTPTEDCEDFKETLQTIQSISPVTLDEATEEGLTDEVALNLEQTKEAAGKVSPDGYLVTLIDDSDPRGYLIKKSASSPAGISPKELCTFFVEELRVKKVQDHLESTYSECVLRERQDTKVRYEVGSNGLKIASLFSDIENSKTELSVADYGISQTSLEQVFNMHAAEAELAKKGTVDN